MKSIAIVGGGPAALFMYKRIIESVSDEETEVFIFERQEQLGAGMPYGINGAAHEHITNVSDNEIPELVTSIAEWIEKSPQNILQEYNITSTNFNEHKVLPRLLFGQYLEEQFSLLQKKAQRKNITTKVFLSSEVVDIKQHINQNSFDIHTKDEKKYRTDFVVICSGHMWPKEFEDKVPGWYDSPYPPQKLKKKINFPVAIRGASLTAIDAIRTLAHENGKFEKNEDDTLNYLLDTKSNKFKIFLHSIDGLLPAIRFHLADKHLAPKDQIRDEEVPGLKEKFGGFIPLDYIFERNFKNELKEDDPDFYNSIKEMTVEEFATHMLSLRKAQDPFELFKKEYLEAERSIDKEESVYWKEVIAKLSYAMNYPAKHMSAEDMLRATQVLKPLISIVIAFVPQNSCREVLALHEAGLLEMINVDKSSIVAPGENGGAKYSFENKDGELVTKEYQLYINGVGQPPMFFNDFPFVSLKNEGVISSAWIAFQQEEIAMKQMAEGNKNIEKTESGNYILHVPGININDNFQVLDRYGVRNKKVYIMAVPFIAGLNPDYSGLDFCELASEKIAAEIFEDQQ